MAILLDGKKVRNDMVELLKIECATFSHKPKLVIIQVGNRQDSNVYIKQKKLLAQKIGVEIVHEIYPETISQEALLKEIDRNNKSTEVNGIIVQMPVPAHLNRNALIEAVHPNKDVDGLTSANAAALYLDSKSGFLPATARGILNLLDYYKIGLAGKHVVVVGRSVLVGRPTALALLHRDATITLAHKHSENLKKIVQAADIVIVAIGNPEFMTQDYFAPGQVIIDVGINTLVGEADGKGKVVGDVAFAEVERIVQAISPVPGGVGPMTVTALMQNVIEAYKRQQQK